MTNNCYFLPMSKCRTIALLAYDGFQLLDVTGPAAVFAAANGALKRKVYDVTVLSPAGGVVTSDSGVALATRAMARLPANKVDTLLIAGAEETALRAAMSEPAVRRAVPRYAAKARRFGSVCSGAFVLAALQLIDGRRVATHWEACGPLAARYPKITVDPDALYVVDGKVWTSAGVTTGIDMALAMVEEDHGAEIANAIARRLVLYARRPGYQSQFSPLLSARIKAESPFADLIDWMQNNLDRPLHVPTLAARAGLGERSFYRRFSAATGSSPAHFVEALRLEAARTLIDGDLPLKGVAAKVGLTSIRLNNAFERRFGVAPRLFRDMHRTTGPGETGRSTLLDRIADHCGLGFRAIPPTAIVPQQETPGGDFE
jgi:transcriptional regulator GlxA family with amidase domain